MKIVDVTVRQFHCRSQMVRDSEGHAHPGAEHDATSSLLTIHTDEGAEGYCFGAGSRDVIEHAIKPALIGQDPFYREKLWQSLRERSSAALPISPAAASATSAGSPR